MPMELEEAGTDLDHINVSTETRNSSLADSLPLFPGHQGMQVSEWLS